MKALIDNNNKVLIKDGDVVTMDVQNSHIMNFTLLTQQSTNVTLGTIPDNVYAHINDTNFSVNVICTDPSSLATYDDYGVSVSNNPDLPMVSTSYVVYGYGARKSSSSVQHYPVYYPPNSTNNDTALGGLGKIWHNGKTLMYKSGGYYMGAGTYRIIFTW